MKFGKEILSQQIPGWSKFYLDYKALKKIISALAAKKPIEETAEVPVRPSQLLLSTTSPPNPGGWEDSASIAENTTSTEASISILSTTAQDDDRGPEFQRYKAMFFFKLERELEKINAFYLQKEAELKLRLATLLSKRKAAAFRKRVETDDSNADVDGAEWLAVEEGFRLLQRDLSKLQQFIDINATGFRKILKKWDKRSKSQTKELYLARQVEVQPCFNRQLISELSDTVAGCVLDLANVSATEFDGHPTSDMIFNQQIAMERNARRGAFNDFEANLHKALANQDISAVKELIELAGVMLQQQDGRTHVMRILWKYAIQAPPKIADAIMSSTPFDFHFVDDINGRTCLHEAAIAGELRLVGLCLEKKSVEVDRVDVYGRSALHYAAMNGHDLVSQQLLSAGADPNTLDMDNYTPLIYAITNGKTECVRVLLADSRVTLNPPEATNDLIPLTLACQFGHVDVALLLLQHGAQNIANTNGEYPIHLAAREGHAAVCRLLIHQDIKDVADKYSEWTPLFHSARFGHADCVDVLLEAGCDAHAVDDTGKTPIFYSAWYGHVDCVNKLLIAMLRSPKTGPNPRTTNSISPLSDAELPPSDGDVDMIPSLSLPPPIMPFRIYGHNYLDKTFLIQVALGTPFSRREPTVNPVQFLPSVTSLMGQPYPKAGSALKLVMTSKPDTTSPPHSIVLPLSDEKETFAFQLHTLEDLTLEFSFYPTFGSKTIGRAVALPSAFRNIVNGSSRVLPILDHRLHVIGQVSFEICIIRPFNGVTLEIGGTVETYWKSTAIPFSGGTNQSHRPPAVRSLSASTSPSNRNQLNSANNSVTLSSLSGEYVHVIVQVTRDFIPVVFNGWVLPIPGFDLGVSDVTYEQFQILAKTSGKAFNTTLPIPSSAWEWHRRVSVSLISLEALLKLLPLSYGISLEVAYPNQNIKNQHHLGRAHELNLFVDSVLKTVYDVSSMPKGTNGVDTSQSRRKIVFTSFSPNVCTALNWKQPNYAVFFASHCGLSRDENPSGSTLVPDQVETDQRCSSVDAAVEFAKANNLLGVLVDGRLLVQIPSLIQGVKDSGILLAAFGSKEHVMPLSFAPLSIPASDAPIAVDAILQDRGVLSYIDHALRASV